MSADAVILRHALRRLVRQAWCIHRDGQVAEWAVCRFCGGSGPVAYIPPLNDLDPRAIQHHAKCPVPEARRLAEE
jgi:hypothetical protein